MKIGIFGGTFDPCHAGHYAIVKKVLEEQVVDRVVVVPSVVKYYREGKSEMFSNVDKLKILRAWFDGLDNVAIDDMEYVRASSGADVSSRRYIGALKDIIYKYGEGNEYFTMIGTDSLYNFKTWYKWQDILKLSKLIVVQRDGASIELNETVADIERIPMTIDNKFLTDSSSAIREKLQEEKEKFQDADVLKSYIEDVLVTLGEEFGERRRVKVESEVASKLNRIAKWLADPYKDDETRWSLIEDLVKGTI